MLRIFQTSPWVNISCLAVVHNYNDSLVIYQQSFSTSLIFQFVSPHDISRVIVAEERNGSLAHHQIAICQRVWCFMQTKATSKAFSASQICWWLALWRGSRRDSLVGFPHLPYLKLVLLSFWLCRRNFTQWGSSPPPTIMENAKIGKGAATFTTARGRPDGDIKEEEIHTGRFSFNEC